MVGSRVSIEGDYHIFRENEFYKNAIKSKMPDYYELVFPKPKVILTIDQQYQ